MGDSGEARQLLHSEWCWHFPQVHLPPTPAPGLLPRFPQRRAWCPSTLQAGWTACSRRQSPPRAPPPQAQRPGRPIQRILTNRSRAAALNRHRPGPLHRSRWRRRPPQPPYSRPPRPSRPPDSRHRSSRSGLPGMRRQPAKPRLRTFLPEPSPRRNRRLRRQCPPLHRPLRPAPPRQRGPAPGPPRWRPHRTVTLPCPRLRCWRSASGSWPCRWSPALWSCGCAASERAEPAPDRPCRCGNLH